jgi:hypothetical protein
MADPTGAGGRARERKIDAYVDSANSGPRTTTTTDPAYVQPKAKPAYVPSAREKATKSYGAPVSEPIVRMREGQSTDSSNKY